MKGILVLLAAWLLVSSGKADVYTIAKQEARNVANGLPPQGQPSQPSQPNPASPPPNPALQATLQNINNLVADFESLVPNPTNTVALKSDLAAAAQSIKPKPALVDRLAHDLATAIAGNQKLPGQFLRLAQFVHALLNGSHLSTAQQQSVLAGVQKILLAGEVPQDAVTRLMDSLTAASSATQ